MASFKNLIAICIEHNEIMSDMKLKNNLIKHEHPFISPISARHSLQATIEFEPQSIWTVEPLFLLPVQI